VVDDAGAKAWKSRTPGTHSLSGNSWLQAMLANNSGNPNASHSFERLIDIAWVYLDTP
jgi:hypothetical protein